jgi:hypothetical protein
VYAILADLGVASLPLPVQFSALQPFQYVSPHELKVAVHIIGEYVFYIAKEDPYKAQKQYFIL